MKLYKYTTMKRGLEIINNNSVVLSHPQDFNDPYDSFPKWDENELDKACRIVVDFGIEITFVNFIENILTQKGKFKGKMIASIVLKEYHLMKKLVKIRPSKYTPVLTLDKLNKLFSLLNKFGKNTPEQQEVKKQLDASIALKKEDSKEKISILKNLREKLLIACFSTCKDSTLMWAHYADSHKEICIEFDIPEEEEKMFQKVIYSGERPTNNFLQAVRKMCGQHLANGKFDETDKAVNKLLIEPYLTKSQEWEYEKEYRLIFSDKDTKTNNNFDKIQCNDGLVRTTYKMPPISAIYTGAQFSQQVDQLSNVCALRGIKLSKIVLSKDTYCLN